MKPIILITAMLAAVCFSPLIVNPASAADKAAVRSNALPVHSDVTKRSSVVATLRRGEAVSIQYEVNGAEGKWCFIEASRDLITGYVPCSGLRREGAAAMRSGSGGQNSDVRVVLYMTDW